MSDEAARKEADQHHPNVERIRGFYDAMNARDYDAIASYVDDNLSASVPGNSILAGDYTGGDQWVDLCRLAFGETDNTFHWDLLDTMSAGEYVLTRHRWTASRRGRSIEQVNFNMYKLGEDGRIVQRWEFSTDMPDHDVFWRP